MLNREKANLKISNICKSNIDNAKWAKSNSLSISNVTGLPINIVNDILTLRGNIADYDDFIVFLILNSLSSNSIKECFTESEIKTWSNKRYKVLKYGLPIKWKAIKINYDQYAVMITASELIKLRDNQFINYDENQQRSMRRIENGNSVYYSIDVDHKQIKNIEQALIDETYIPDPITLNMPETAEFYYDEENMELVINDLDMFNIIDGYHRYLAVSNVYSMNKDFDRNLMFQIVQFSESKAQQFIWQQDQKHKMRKIDSASLNQYDIATKIVNGLNTASGFELAGEINRNAGVINSAELTGIINAIFITNKNLSRVKAKEIEFSTRKLLANKINTLVENDISIATKKWDYRYMVSAIFICSIEEIDDNKLNEEVNKLYSKIKSSEYNHLFSVKPFTKINYNRLTKIYNGEE